MPRLRTIARCLRGSDHCGERSGDEDSGRSRASSHARIFVREAKVCPEFRNIVLTSEKLSDLGNSATFYSVLVEVECAKPHQ